MSVESIYRWHERDLVALDYCDMTDTSIAVADSWFVTDGSVLGLDLHRRRFLESMPDAVRAATDADGFWSAAVGLLSTDADWFPRVELQRRSGSHLLVARIRSSPDRTNNIVVATWTQGDPRTVPAIKGPDLETMTRLRTTVQARGAAEAVILTPDGYVVETSQSGLVWWRGEILCGPPAEFARVDSVTVRSLLTLAQALGVETWEEAMTPNELAGTEIWSLNALHGIRLVTKWIDGPEVAQLPGRLALWRARMDALRKSI
jgi:branched-subunit amino acid aminotransferase/4-amino-4-deoxychorismate lyase